MSMLRLALALGARSLRRPTLAVDLARVSWRFRNRHWYRRPPFLPIPDRNYVRWRMDTAYGSPDFLPPVDDVERYVRWASRG
ncbi:MAG TPA: hypothetical protein VN602_03075 [Gemmatimonadaceae bacterium]|nr:hypothetical protein [Gemmatimonadaceae bacterium]